MGTGKRTRDAAAAFFYKWAGYAQQPGESKQAARWRGARELASNERHAETMGWSFRWEPDPDGMFDHDDWCSERSPHGHEVYSCLAVDAHGAVLASLSAIVDPDAAYRRVVEADLASEARATILLETLEAI